MRISLRSILGWLHRKQPAPEQPPAVVAIPTVYVQSDVLDETAGLIASFGAHESPHEGIAYWAGVQEGATWVVTTVIVPNAATTAGSFRTSPVANALAVARANELGLTILAQVHGHPGSWVGHSAGDDEGAFMPTPSADPRSPTTRSCAAVPTATRSASTAERRPGSGQRETGISTSTSTMRTAT